MKFLISIDKILFEFFNGWAGKIHWFDWVFAVSAEYLIFAIGAAILFFLIRYRRQEQMLVAIALLGAAIGRLIFIPIVRFLFFRTRPFAKREVTQLVFHDPSEPSFPSGHTAVMFAIAFAVFSYSRRWGILFLILASWSALSRVIVGVHYPADIASGVIVAFISFLISKKLVDFLWKKYL